MRSRYCAYVLGLEAYLLGTWHVTTRPETMDLNQLPQPQWFGLSVKGHGLRPAKEGKEAAFVEFVARFKLNGRAQQLHEVSEFLREDGRWYYVTGTFPGESEA